MKISLRFKVFLVLVTLVSGLAHSQTAITQLHSDLISAWYVTVEGEDRARALRITAIAQKSPDAFFVESTYGWADGNLTPVRAELSVSGLDRKLSIVTQADSKIEATQQSEGRFAGTFTIRSGAVKQILLERISDSDLAQKKSSTVTKMASKAPGADVPSGCAAYFGNWSGAWAQGGIGTQWLRVFSVDSNCVAKYSYLSDARMPTALKTIEIKDGIMAVPCGTNSTCVFNRKGDELWGSYSSSSGNNNGVFRKAN